MSDNVGISAPWVTYAREVNALFEYDEEVEVEYDNEEVMLTVRVANESKADALGRLIPSEKTFGNVTLRTRVLPANEDESAAAVFARAFANNPVFVDVVSVDSGGFEATYAVFEPEVAQFFNDELGSLHGVRTMTYEDVAKDVLDSDGVLICSDLETISLGTPLGEWP